MCGFSTTTSTILNNCCRNPNCRCADPARRHGPYWQLTWKQAGKTVSRRLSEEEARLWAEWIDNRRRLESVVQEMKDVSRRAGDQLRSEIGHTESVEVVPSALFLPPTADHGPVAADQATCWYLLSWRHLTRRTSLVWRPRR